MAGDSQLNEHVLVEQHHKRTTGPYLAILPFIDDTIQPIYSLKKIKRGNFLKNELSIHLNESLVAV
jgi:hypothetical protein